MDFSKLVEARIMDFQRRKARGDVQEAPELTAASGSLEVQLISEIRALRRGAKEARDPDEKRATLTKAAGLQTQLVVLLEKTGRTLLARNIDEHLSE